MIVTTYQWYKGPMLPDDQLDEDGNYPQSWFDEAEPIAGATEPDYNTSEEDFGYAIFVKVTTSIVDQSELPAALEKKP